jgi:hypothetical protein
MTGERYDVLGAIETIRHNLTAPHPVPAQQECARLGREMADDIARNECPTEAIAKTWGHALIVGSATVGNLASCPHELIIVNVQAIAGYYLLTGDTKT